MRTIAVLFLALALAGCQTTKPTVVVQNQVVPIPGDLLTCGENAVHYPDPNTLTDHQVATLLVELNTRLTKCGNDVQAIKQLQAIARSRIEGVNPVPGDEGGR